MTTLTTKTPTTPTTDERIAERIAKRIAVLTTERAERKDLDDLPLSMTRRQANEYLAATAALDARIATIRNAAADLVALDSEADTKWRDFLVSARATLAAELGTLPSPLRERRAQDTAADLSWSVKLIDLGLGIAKLGIVTLEHARIGQLMNAAGFAVSGAALRGPNGWQGALPEVETRIKQVAKQRAEAHAALDVALRTDEEVAAHEAEAAVRRAVLNTMCLRGFGPTLTAYTLDTDELLLPSAMTDAQRKAFEWFAEVSA